MVVRAGEDVDSERMECLCEKVSSITRLYGEQLTVVIVGSSLPYPYLRELVIDPAKNMGARILHINPDEHYNSIMDDYANDAQFRSHESLKCKPQPILREDEEWWKLNAFDGIEKLFQ